MPKKEQTSQTVVLGPTPVSVLWDKLLLLPIVGTIDSRRAQELMETMLAKIDEEKASVTILDVRGVPTVDSAVANHLIKITKATRLMGCECIICGISAAVAQTMVSLGVDLRDIITIASLKDAVVTALERLGLEIVEAPKSTTPVAD
jgi:anti-anti-sigma factor